MAIQFVWPLPDKIGTLTLDVKHGTKPTDQRDVLLVELTARGKAVEEIGMETWFSTAHDAIVNTFSKSSRLRKHTYVGENTNEFHYAYSEPVARP